MQNGFDLGRVFLGESGLPDLGFLLEIVLRTTVMYLYTILLARLVGRGGIGQIGPFEFVLVIAVGSAAGDPMFYPEVPLLHGILVITVVILLHRVTGLLLGRFKRLEETIEGAPLLVVRDGRILDDAVEGSGVTRRELVMLLRIEGVRDTAEIERAYLEPSGAVSVFRRPGQAGYADGEPTWPAGHGR